jgi:MraZ protein
MFGEFGLTIDDKGRIMLPPEVRQQLDPEEHGEAFFIVIGVNRKPWLYPERGYEALVARVKADMEPGDDRVAFDQLYFSMASREEWDEQGWLIIPPETRRRTELEKNIVMVGVRDHYELWNRQAWQDRRNEVLHRCSLINGRSRL